MYYTGFADEAAESIDRQIAATRELGWTNIESRSINRKNIHDISDADFDSVCGALEKAGVHINCFGSTIANWSKQITDPFENTLQEARRAIPRMQRLGTKMIRIMSYAVLKGKGPEEQMFEERIRRLVELKKMFDDAGIQAVHENCMNYGGMGWRYTLRLIEGVPGLKLVFDTGNPVFADDVALGKPGVKQSAWEFYEKVREHVVYVHIKDGKWDCAAQKSIYTYAGDGDGAVKKIIADLLSRGYDGGFSIEPHLGAVFHDPTAQSEEDSRYRTYIEYGRRFMKLADDIRRQA